jgi:hypothetical protein
MAHSPKLAIPRAARNGRFEDVQKTFPLTRGDAKKIDDFLESYVQTRVVKKTKAKGKRSLTLAKG